MFTVVIPLYNKESSIKNTLESVLNQQYGDFEVVIVNDGSTDESLTVVEQFQDSRIRIFDQDNQGVSAARNRGIREAKFEWIAFLDADDFWLENHLLTISLMMKKYPDEKVFVTSFQYSNRVYSNRRTIQNGTYLIENFFKEYFPFRDLICTITTVVQKKALLEIGGYDIRLSLGEDMDLWARLGKAFSMVKSEAITAIYRVDAENRSDTGRYAMEKSFLGFLDFDQMGSIEEKAFYAFWLRHKSKYFIKKMDIKNLTYIIKKHYLHLFY